ncbi:MAG: helix-turn-helix domain-containing protein [Planctomycetota bacterium]
MADLPPSDAPDGQPPSWFSERWERTLILASWLGHLDMRPRDQHRRQPRPDYELLYVRAGVLRLTLPGEHVDLSPDQACLLPPGTGFIQTSPGDDTRVVVANFRAHSVDGWEPLPLLGVPRQVTLARARLDLDRLDACCLACEHSDPETRSERRLLLRQLADRYLLDGFAAGRFAATIDRPLPSWLATALGFCARRFPRSDWSVADIAVAAGVSASHLAHGFREHLGTTPMVWLRDLRLREAAAQITADPTTALAAIATRCGFADYRHFARCFRQRFGCSPRAYRQRGTPAHAD